MNATPRSCFRFLAGLTFVILLAGIPAIAEDAAPATGAGPGAALPGGSGTEERDVAALLRRGRSQYLAGEPTAAAQTFARVLELEPGNAVAADFMRRITAGTIDGNGSRVQTTAQLLNEVGRAWQRPRGIPAEPGTTNRDSAPPVLQRKLDAIVVPSVNFSGLELGRVVNTLSAISEEFDQTSPNVFTTTRNACSPTDCAGREGR